MRCVVTIGRERSRVRLQRVWVVPDFVLRLLFFAGAPWLILYLALAYPLTGALINVARRAPGLLHRSLGQPNRRALPLVGRLLRRQLAFETYYRKRPPRPFLYYVFYPLLFPYWLINREARSEFLLFKGTRRSPSSSSWSRARCSSSPSGVRR